MAAAATASLLLRSASSICYCRNWRRFFRLSVVSISSALAPRARANSSALWEAWRTSRPRDEPCLWRAVELGEARRWRSAEPGEGSCSRTSEPMEIWTASVYALCCGSSSFRVFRGSRLEDRCSSEPSEVPPHTSSLSGTFFCSESRDFERDELSETWRPRRKRSSNHNQLGKAASSPDDTAWERSASEGGMGPTRGVRRVKDA